MKHYTKEELELFRHDRMSVLGRIACAAHLKNCEDCAARLRELEEEDRFVERQPVAGASADDLACYHLLGKNKLTIKLQRLYIHSLTDSGQSHWVVQYVLPTNL